MRAPRGGGWHQFLAGLAALAFLILALLVVTAKQPSRPVVAAASEPRGYRDGQTIYSAQGNLLEKIYPDSLRTVMIALQGSSTFYDRIEVTPINPPSR